MMPRPYDRQRPRTIWASSDTEASRAASRVDFPTPGCPSTVTMRGRPSAVALSSSERRCSSSAFLPTIGRSCRRRCASEALTDRSRYAATRSALPFRGSGSTATTSTDSSTSR